MKKLVFLALCLWTASADAGTYVPLPADIVYTDKTQALTGPKAETPVTLSVVSTTITPNQMTGQNFEVTLTSACTPCTFANPSNAGLAGQQAYIKIIQPASGGPATLTWGSSYTYPGHTNTLTLSTAANAVDFVTYAVDNAGNINLGLVGNAFAH